MATSKQTAAARANVRMAQAAAKRKQTLRHLPKSTRTALGQEAGKVRRGESKTRRELEAEARRLQIRGRSKMGKDELRPRDQPCPLSRRRGPRARLRRERRARAAAGSGNRIQGGCG